MPVSTGASSRQTSGHGSGTLAGASIQITASHALASASEDAVSPKRCYTAANLRDCVLAEVLAGVVLAGVLGFGLVLALMPLIGAAWLGLEAWRGLAALVYLW